MKTILMTVLVILMGLSATTKAQTGDGAEKESSDKLTLWLVGDSTMRNGTKGQQGWGDPIKEMFDSSKITVENRGRGGRSSRTFQTEGLWQSVLDSAKPGDYVLIQMGHNDSGKIVGDNRNRGTIRSGGDEVQEVVMPDGKPETVHSYGWYMRKYAQDAKAKGLVPIIASYVPRCPRGGPIEANPEMSSYRLWAKEAAEKEDVAFIDLYGIIWEKYTKMTPEQIKSELFTEADFTHTSPEGAKFNAVAVVEGIRMLDLPLKQYLKSAQ